MAAQVKPAPGAPPPPPLDPAVRATVSIAVRGGVWSAPIACALAPVATFATPELPLRDPRGPTRSEA